jgi:hypothetical protein
VWSRKLSCDRWGTTPREDVARKDGVSIWIFLHTTLPSRGPAISKPGSRWKENISGTGFWYFGGCGTESISGMVFCSNYILIWEEIGLVDSPNRVNDKLTTNHKCRKCSTDDNPLSRSNPHQHIHLNQSKQTTTSETLCYNGHSRLGSIWYHPLTLPIHQSCSGHK